MPHEDTSQLNTMLVIESLKQEHRDGENWDRISVHFT